MAATATGQPPPEVGLVIASGGTYAEKLKPKTSQYQPIPLKPITYLHGEPQVIWEQEEVNQMIVNENLEYAVIGKFSYGWPDIQDLRKLIPKQCELKGDCNIGLLSNRHVLIRATLLEDYVHLLSKPVDMATKNQTRPSCARVKVEVDLLKEFPKRIKIGMRMQNKEVVEKWITIKYDYVLKYCQTCMIQGHNEDDEKSQQEEGKKTDDQPCNENNKGKGIDQENENRKGDGFVEPTHKVDGSNNSKGVKEAGRVTSSERTISEVRNQEKHADPKNLQKGVNEEELMQNSTAARSSYTKRRKGEVTSRNLFASNYEEERDNVVEEGEISKGPDLIEEEEGEIQNKKDTEEEEDIDFNIQQISKAGDLSPRHTDSLKNGARKGRPIILLQVKTRSSRDRGSSIDQ
ncbi:hypothetical protein KY289_026765 [Solanum tuberosum]|nr:hypothetical protein KY289_026765 [Solanum tuberosum]